MKYEVGKYVEENQLGKRLTFDELEEMVGELAILDRSTVSRKWYMVVKVKGTLTYTNEEVIILVEEGKDGNHSYIDRKGFEENEHCHMTKMWRLKQEGDESVEQIVSLEENIKSIKTELNNTKLSYVRTGFYLKQARDNFDWGNTAYSDVWEYAQVNFGLSKSTASRYMDINDRFSIDGNSTEILPEYTEYSKSSLAEILQLTPEEEKQSGVNASTPVSKIREIKTELHPENQRKKDKNVPDMDKTKYPPVSEAQKQEFKQIIANMLVDYFQDSVWQNGKLLEDNKKLSLALYKIKIEKPLKYKECEIEKKTGFFTVRKGELTYIVSVHDIVTFMSVKESVATSQHTETMKEFNQRVADELKGLVEQLVEEHGLDFFNCADDVELVEILDSIAPCDNYSTKYFTYVCETEERSFNTAEIACKLIELYPTVIQAKKENIPLEQNFEPLPILDEESVNVSIQGLDFSKFLNESNSLFQYDQIQNVIYKEINRMKLQITEENIDEIVNAVSCFILQKSSDYAEYQKSFSSPALEEPEQPELPKLTNNAKRSEFIDNYLTWHLWIDQEETGERIYKYTFENGVYLAVRVKKQHSYDYKAHDKKTVKYCQEEYYLGNATYSIGKVDANSFKVDLDRTFADCATNKSILIEYLKEYQKRRIERE